jgi:hypothetical protein
MVEVMKTMIEQKMIDAGRLTVGSMYQAVLGNTAEEVWEFGECVRPPASMFSQPPIREFELNFD